MENAQLINLSRQIVLRRQLDVLANNVANINTTGYKSEKLAFEEYLMPVASAEAFRTGDTALSYVNDYRSAYDFSAGPTVPTGNPLDVAIDGKGWFSVATPDGERFTRNGAFAMNTKGQLVARSGHPVLGAGGPITLGRDDTDIVIAADGTVSTNNGVRGRLRVSAFENEDALRPVGDNLFAADDPRPAPSARIVQGMLENSNVSGVVEMVRLIDVSRTYQTVSRMMKDTDELQRKAIETLGGIEA